MSGNSMSAETGMVGVSSRPKGKRRMWIVAVLLFVILVAYLDRVNVSILIADPVFLEDMGLKGESAKQGLLMTFFLIPYAISNIALGYLGDRLGPRIAMSISIFLWSVALFIGGAARSFAAMLGAKDDIGLRRGPSLSHAELLRQELVSDARTSTGQRHLGDWALTGACRCHADCRHDYQYLGLACFVLLSGDSRTAGPAAVDLVFHIGPSPAIQISQQGGERLPRNQSASRGSILSDGRA